jgi:hypothetical protein
VTNGAAAEITDEVRAAHRELVESFGLFVQRFGEAQELGIDAGAVVAQSLHSILPAEQWAQLPLPLRMMFGG